MSLWEKDNTFWKWNKFFLSFLYIFFLIYFSERIIFIKELFSRDISFYDVLKLQWWRHGLEREQKWFHRIHQKTKFIQMQIFWGCVWSWETQRDDSSRRFFLPHQPPSTSWYAQSNSRLWILLWYSFTTNTQPIFERSFYCWVKILSSETNPFIRWIYLFQFLWAACSNIDG